MLRESVAPLPRGAPPRCAQAALCTDHLASGFRMLSLCHRYAMRISSITLIVVAVSTLSPGAVSGAVSGGLPWLWPVAAPHPLVASFVAPATRYGAGHRGIDVAAAAGMPIVSPADGTVYFAGVVVDRPVLTIEHPGGVLSSFEPVSSDLVVGAIVHRGETIGSVATGGHCSGHCLHFGVRSHGQYVSPLNYLGGVTRPVLLPTRAQPSH